MSLRVRLVLLIVALVTVVAIVLSVLHLDSLMRSISIDVVRRSELAAQETNTLILALINRDSSESEATVTPEERKSAWKNIVSGDADIGLALEKMLTLSAAIVEINVVGEDGKILTSSNPDRSGKPKAQLQAFEGGPRYRHLLDLLTHGPEYEVTGVPLGISQSEQIFTVQVVTSSLLLRDALKPEVKWLAPLFGGVLLGSLILTALATNWVLRPIKRIEQTIDRIVQGNFHRGEAPHPLAKEFAVVQSKLNVLGEQFLGAREAATEKQHSLDQLVERMASQLDVASRFAAISRISGGVAHEIKNPLNAISLHLDLLRARLGAPNEKLGPEIDILSKEVTRLDRVVKTFLDFSRPVEVRFQEVDLASLAREVADLIAPQARVARIELQFEAPAVIDAMWIRGDADMLKQAMLNLVTNALEAMKNGGGLRLSVLRDGNAITLEVADNGPGIPPDMRNKVFQLYFTTKTRGSGIGLAMTYRAVQLHNGTIEFTSEEGQGTTFRLQFPALVGHA